MLPEVEQELAHTLLIELLAYQFASPVRWIETQDVFLSETLAERIVEIGPAETLNGMAKRTLAAKYEAYDAAKSLQRQILTYSKDAKEIYYEAEPEADEPEAPAAAPAGSSVAPAAAAAAAPVAAAAPPPPSAGPAAQVPDAPVQAVDIVRALIAQKLKKGLLEVPLSKAIKDLVGGRCPVSPPPPQFAADDADMARQIDPPKRDSRRSWQRVWLDAREARRCSARRARRVYAGDV
jgi:fatty acid synthase subunit alpha